MLRPTFRTMWITHIYWFTMYSGLPMQSHYTTPLLISCICDSGSTVPYILKFSTRLRVARLTPWPFWFRGTIPRCALDRRLGGLDGRSGRLPKNKSASGLNVTSISPSSIQQPNHCTNWATLGVGIMSKVQKTKERMNCLFHNLNL